MAPFNAQRQVDLTCHFSAPYRLPDYGTGFPNNKVGPYGRYLYQIYAGQIQTPYFDPTQSCPVGCCSNPPKNEPVYVKQGCMN